MSLELRMSEKENMVSNKTHTEALMFLFEVLNLLLYSSPDSSIFFFYTWKFLFLDAFFQVTEIVCMSINLINLSKQPFIVKVRSSLNT